MKKRELPLYFGGDGEYDAYFIDEPCIIPNHYQLVYVTTNVLKIIDDDNLEVEILAKVIKIYRACNYGCIIYAIGGTFDRLK